jgi:L-arabinokinase
MLAVYVSGHGYGHATRTAEVLRELRTRQPELPISIVSTTPEFLFHGLPGARVQHHARACDVGVVQRDALTMDEPGTARAWAAFAANWEARVEHEARWLRALGARLVLADVPPLACAAGARAELPVVALANFSWDWIYRHLARRVPELAQAAQRCAQAYAHTELLLQLPFAGDLAVFPRQVALPLLARHPRFTREQARARLGWTGERRLLVLWSFGGAGLPGFDPSALAHLAGEAVFVLPGAGTNLPANVVVADAERLAARGLAYQDLVGAVDVVVTKPGYGIVTDAIAAGTALVYTERGDFPEYPILVREMQSWLVTAPVSNADLHAGRLTSALDAVRGRVAAPPPALDGAAHAATHLLSRLARA